MLSDNLKRIREKQGYSKMKLARMSGVSRRTIEFIEYKKTNPNYKTILSLSNALNVSVEELIK